MSGVFVLGSSLLGGPDVLGLGTTPKSVIQVIGFPGGAIAGPNYIVQSFVNTTGDNGAPYLVEYDFSLLFGPDDMLNEYIVRVVSPGGSYVTQSAANARPLSQVNQLLQSYPSGGSCVVKTNYDRFVTLGFSIGEEIFIVGQSNLGGTDVLGDAA